MSKNLTRKGLALGALIGLGSSLIAGPAYAAQTITVSPALGTSLVTTLGSKFVVAANVGSGVSDTASATLKFSISNAGKNLKTFAAVDTSATAANTAAKAGATVADTTNTTIVTAASTGMTAAKTAAVAIETTATVTTEATVTAFLDQNGNGTADAGEDTGNSVTIKFIAAADLTATTSLTAPLIGATALKGSATTSPVLNGNYADIKLVYTSATAMTPANGEYVATQTAATGVWAVDAVTVSATAGTYTVQVKAGGTAIGTASSAVTPAISVATGTAALTVGNDALANGNVRAGAKSATAVLTYKKAVVNGVAAAVGAGVPVVVTVTTTAVTTPATSLITVDGTAIATAAAGTITLNKVTDANGLVSLPIASATGTVGDKITISAVAEGVALTANLVVEWKAVTYTLTDSRDDTNASQLRAMTRGGSLSFNLEAKDQFGVGITGGARAKLVATGGTAGTFYYNFVGGKVTATYTDTQTTTTTSNVLNFSLETQDSASLNWAAPASGAVALAAGQVTAAVTSTALSFTAVPNQTAGTFTGNVTGAAYTATPTNGVAVTATGAATLSTSVAGAAVKISGKGLGFKVADTAANVTASTKVYADEVEFFSGAAGVFAFTVFSTKSGAQTITLTTGTATTSVVVTFTAGSAASVTLSAPAQAQAGQALDVTVKALDQWGNLTSSAAAVGGGNAGFITLSATGAGYLNASSVVVPAAGSSSVKLISGGSDLGTSTITATLDLATDVTAVANVEFGVTDVTDISSAGKAIYVNTEFAKGKVVTVYINGKRMPVKAAEATDNAVERKYTQRKAGTYTVTVRISGGITASEKIVIK